MNVDRVSQQKVEYRPSLEGAACLGLKICREPSPVAQLVSARRAVVGPWLKRVSAFVLPSGTRLERPCASLGSACIESNRSIDLDLRVDLCINACYEQLCTILVSLHVEYMICDAYQRSTWR